jgi:hypothetical protein
MDDDMLWRRRECDRTARSVRPRNWHLGISQGACEYASQPDKAIKQFGEDALLEWRLGYYRFQGANCTIFSDNQVAQQCTLRVEYSYQRKSYMGEWSTEIQTAQQFRFGSRPDSPIYFHCTSDGAPD